MAETEKAGSATESAEPGRGEVDLSAIVVVGARRDRIEGTLESLLAQRLLPRMEILLVDVCDVPVPPPRAAAHPRVRILILPGACFGPARAHAVQQAQAPVVAFLEEHSRATPGWAEALLAAHQGPWAGVGPRIEDANPEVGLSRVVGLVSYGLFHAPAPAGEVEVLPGHNSSYKLAVLLQYRERLAALLENENVLMARLRADGHRLALEPTAKVLHLNTVDLLSTFRGLHFYSRTYGHHRAREMGWSPVRRLVYVLSTPVIPLYFLVGFHRRLRRLGNPYRTLLWRHLPFVYLCQLMAALGQALALLRGPGSAAERFSHHEMTDYRPESREVG